MFEHGFFKVSRKLFTHQVVLDSSPIYFRILMTILCEMTFGEVIQNDHGIDVKLEPFQLLTTCAKIASTVGCRRDEVHRALGRFESCGILQQEVRHIKTIITLSKTYTCEEEKNETATTFATRLRQDCDTKEERKKKRNFSKEKLKKEKPPTRNQQGPTDDLV